MVIESNRYFLRLFDKSKATVTISFMKVSLFLVKEKLESNFIHFSYKSIEDYFL
jgi:hypothetical protein